MKCNFHNSRLLCKVFFLTLCINSVLVETVYAQKIEKIESSNKVKLYYHESWFENITLKKDYIHT